MDRGFIKIALIVFGTFGIVCFLLFLGWSADTSEAPSQIMSDADSARIIEKYAAEISFISKMKNQVIASFDSDTLEYLKEAIYLAETHREEYSQYRFKEMMDEVFSAIIDWKNAINNGMRIS